MKKKLFIITGASSGLGASLTEELLDSHNHLILISRDKSKLLDFKSKINSSNAFVDAYAIDLAKNSSYNKFNEILKKLDWSIYLDAVLINNAGTILPINHLNETNYDQINNLINLNLIACLSLSQLFMNFCKIKNLNNAYIINISSGVSLNPIEGWGLYCISKAALNMLSSVIANDSKKWEYPIKSIAINPGPLNTAMQKIIRDSDVEKNPIKNKFIEMHEKGELLEPKLIAKKIIRLLSLDPFPNGDFIDLMKS